MDLTKEDIRRASLSKCGNTGTMPRNSLLPGQLPGFLNTDGGDLVIGMPGGPDPQHDRNVGIENEYLHLQEMDRNPDGYRRMLIDSVVRKYLPEIFDSASRSSGYPSR